MTKRPLARLAGTFLALTMALSACAQDDPTTGAGRETQAADANIGGACDANVAVQKGFNKAFSESGPPGEGPPTPEQTRKLQEGLDREVLPHVEAVEANAPQQIEKEVKTAADSVRKFRADPTYDIEGDEKATRAIETIDKYFFDNCDYKKDTVQAVEYNFKSVPSNLKSGEDLVLRLDNQGKELHEFIVLGKKEGVTESWDQILQLDEEQGRAKTNFVGAAFAPPGKDDYGVFSFPGAGDYVAVCFIPQGTTSPEQLGGPGGEGEGPAPGSSPAAGATPAPTAGPSPTAPGGQGGGQGGPPHFTLGMRTELKVA